MYTCTGPLGPFNVPASVSLANLPDALTAGVPVPAGTPFTLDLDEGALDNGLSTLLSTVGGTVLGANTSVNQISVGLGTTPVTTTVTSPLLTSVGTGLLGVSGTLGSFTPTTDGLPVPTSFDLVGTVLGIPVLGNGIPCTYQPGTSSTVTIVSSGGTTTTTMASGAVVKQKSKLKAHQIGRRAALRITVKNQVGKATGRVVAKLHGKRVGKGTLTDGHLRMKVKRLKHGVNRVRVVYHGDAVTGGAHVSVRMKLVRR